jgi:STE24 endopeptidase
MFYIFALFSIFIDNRSLYHAFGFHKEFPIIIGFILFSDALAPMDTVVKLLMNILSRKFEFEAGMFHRTFHQTDEANRRQQMSLRSSLATPPS